MLARRICSLPGLKSTLDPAVLHLPPVKQGPSGTGGDGAALQSVPSLGCDSGGEKAGSLRRSSPNLAIRRDAQGHHRSHQRPAPHHKLWGSRGSWRNIVHWGHQEEGRECSGSSPHSSSPSQMCIFIMTTLRLMARKYLEEGSLLLFLTKASYDLTVVQTVCQPGKR